MLNKAINFIDGSNVSDYQIQVIKKFNIAIFSNKFSLLQLTYFHWFIIFILISILAIILTKKLNSLLLSKMFITTVIISLGYVIYALILLTLYVSGGFIESEAIRLASYERYMETYVFSSLIFIIFVIIDEITRYLRSVSNNDLDSPSYKVLRYKYIEILLPNVFALFLFYSILIGVWTSKLNLGFLENIRPKVDTNADAVYKNQASLINANTYSNDAILVISQDDNGWNYWRLNYYILPKPTSWLWH